MGTNLNIIVGLALFPRFISLSESHNSQQMLQDKKSMKQSK